MAPDSIQVIIPARDVAATIGAVVAALRAQGLGRIRVVDHGSRDDTAAAAGLAGAAVLKEPEPGYGQACARGYRELGAEVRWVLFCAADGVDEVKAVKALVAAAEAGADLVLGCRVRAAQEFGQGWTTTLIRWGWGRRFGDVGALRLVRRETLETMALADRADGWAAEMQVRAVELKAKVVEIPVGGSRAGRTRGRTEDGWLSRWRRWVGVVALLGRMWWRKGRR